MDLKLEKVFTLFLRKNFYFVDEKEAKLQLESHPDFPSLRSVTDTLDYLEIEHLAISVPKEALDQLPDCFLAIIDTQNQQKNSLVAVEKKNGKVVLHNVDDKQEMDEAAFLEIWEGVVVAVEPNVAEKGAKPLKGIFSPELLGVGILAVLLGYIFFSQGPAVSSVAYLVASLAGLGVSILILREEFGQGSKLVDRICNATQATSCQEVLSSKGAKLIGGYGLSDMGLIYFITVTSTVMLGLVELSFLTGLNILAIPMILYTWSYQAFKVKKWCVLCLILSATVLAQLTIGLLAQPDFSMISLASVINFAIALVAVAVIWLYVRGLLTSSKDGQQFQRDLLKFKKDGRIFQTLLQQGTAVDVQSAASPASLVLGNPQAATQLIAVTNPMCGYCKAAFEAYDKILTKHGNKVSINLKFNVFILDNDNPGFQIADRMTEIYREKGSEQLQLALREWFDHRDPDKWFASWGKAKTTEEHPILEDHKAWSQKNDINYTPATILQGHLYPKEYELTDLIYFLEEFGESSEEEEVAEETVA